MRAVISMILPIVLVGLYVVDHYQYDDHYSSAIWQQANAEALMVQDELRDWWGNR